MMLTSTYFWAMYAAVAVSLISIKVEWLTRVLEKIMDRVEVLGSYLLPLMPVFIFGIGAYIYGLPDNVQEQVGLDAQGKSVLLDLNIWGWAISPRTPGGMITILCDGSPPDRHCLHDLAFRVPDRRQSLRTPVFHYRILQELLSEGIPPAMGNQL